MARPSKSFGSSDTPWNAMSKKRKFEKSPHTNSPYEVPGSSSSARESPLFQQKSNRNNELKEKTLRQLEAELLEIRAQMGLSADGMKKLAETASTSKEGDPSREQESAREKEPMRENKPTSEKETRETPTSLREKSRKRDGAPRREEEPRRSSRKLSSDDNSTDSEIEIIKTILNPLGQQTIVIPSSQRTTPESDISTAVVPTASKGNGAQAAQSPALPDEYHRIVVDAEFKEALANWGKYAVRLFLSDVFRPKGPSYTFDNDEEMQECSKEFLKNTKINIYQKGKQIMKDFSLGREPVPLKVFDSTGDKEPVIAAPDFNYVAKNCLKKFNQILKKEDFTLCCNCTDGCGLECACVVNSISHGSAFIHKNFILVRDQNFWNSAVFACGPECQCRGKCSNAVPTPEKDVPLELFRENRDMGFAVRTTKDVMPGETVFEFAGEVLDGGDINENYSWCIFDRADKAQDDGFAKIIEKVFDGKAKLPKVSSTEKGPTGYQIHIDPFRKGNMGRFASHSEYPNTLPIRLFQNDLRPEMTKLMFIASRPIPAGAEVFADYGNGYTGFEKCLCNGMGCGKAGRFLRGAQEYTATLIMLNQLFQHIKTHKMKSKGPEIKTNEEERLLRMKLRALRSFQRLNVAKIVKDVDDLLKEREDILNGAVAATSPPPGSNSDDFLTDDDLYE